MNDVVMFILAVLGSSTFTALVTLFFTRRKIAADTNASNVKAASDKVDTTIKVSDLLEKMQSENVDLYQRNTALEKIKTDHVRTIEILTARLEARDTQLATANKQLDLLRNLAEQAPITETLRTQLDGMNQIIAKLQEAQLEATKMMSEKDRILATMFETNRNLEMKKPPKE